MPVLDLNVNIGQHGADDGALSSTRRIPGRQSYRGHNHKEKFRLWISGQVRRVTRHLDTFCQWALVGKGEGNGSGVMLLFVVRLLAPNRMR